MLRSPPKRSEGGVSKREAARWPRSSFETRRSAAQDEGGWRAGLSLLPSLLSVGALPPPVIPAEREARAPESIPTAAEYGFRIRADARPGMTAYGVPRKRALPLHQR